MGKKSGTRYVDLYLRTITMMGWEREVTNDSQQKSRGFCEKPGKKENRDEVPQKALGLLFWGKAMIRVK